MSRASKGEHSSRGWRTGRARMAWLGLMMALSAENMPLAVALDFKGASENVYTLASVRREAEVCDSRHPGVYQRYMSWANSPEIKSIQQQSIRALERHFYEKGVTDPAEIKEGMRIVHERARKNVEMAFPKYDARDTSLCVNFGKFTEEAYKWLHK